MLCFPTLSSFDLSPRPYTEGVPCSDCPDDLNQCVDNLCCELVIIDLWMQYIGVGSRGARALGRLPPRFFGLTESLESRFGL